MAGPGRCLAGPKGARPLPTDPMGPLGPCRAHRPAPVAGRPLTGARIGRFALGGRGRHPTGCATKQAEALQSCVHFAHLYHYHQVFFAGADANYESVRAPDLSLKGRMDRNAEHWMVVNAVLLHYHFTIQLDEGPGILFVHWSEC